MRDHFGREGLDIVAVGGGAGAHDADTAWVLVSGAGDRALGHALGWATRAGAGELHVIVDESEAAVNARRAAGFDPMPIVWSRRGAELVAAVAEPVPEVPHPAEPLEAFRSALHDLGVTVVVEDGVVFGEVRGLEVARVLIADDGVPELRVGVGVFDQEAYAAMADGADPLDGLARLVADVMARRRADALIHPMNRLARERWLRSEVVERPELVDARRLVPVAPLVRRRGLHERQPAAAVGISSVGSSVLVVCTVGVDLDVAPTAGELAVHHRVDEVVVGVPPRDEHRLVRQLVDRLAVPARLQVVPAPWDPTG